ncbi:MAG: Sua5/YciO/YrdC/YwlC family protein, partial [Spirochaetia bacterium]|nr:Sua5/YciO/YrdC/YwlC family protein [Spirochaetia bacterium]
MQKILAEIRDGQVLILPTDTVYAFACALDSPKGINELYRLKNMPENQPLSL